MSECLEYLGDIDFYLEQRSLSNFREIEQKKTSVEPEKRSEISEKTAFEQQKQQKAVQNKINKLENLITELEKELKTMNEQMGEQVQSDDFYQKYSQKEKQLETLMAEWEKLMM